MRFKINCAELHHCIASEALSRIGVQNGVESGLVLGKGFSVPAAFPPPPTKNFLHTPPPMGDFVNSGLAGTYGPHRATCEAISEYLLLQKSSHGRNLIFYFNLFTPKST